MSILFAKSSLKGKKYGKPFAKKAMTPTAIVNHQYEFWSPTEASMI